MKDILGVDIEVGDTIAFATRNGDSAALGAGTVLKVDGKVKVQKIIATSRYRNWQKLEKPATAVLAYPERIVVVKKA